MPASSTAAEHRVGPGRLVALLSGRATFRLAAWGAGVALLAHWGDERFAAYATALGVTGWLITLSASGTEKAALALLPRSSANGALLRFLVLVGVLPVAVSLVLAGVAAAASGSTTLAAAAVASTSIGCVSVLVGVMRLRGAFRWDTGAFALLGAAHLATVALAVWVGAGPAGVLWSLAAVSVATVAGLLVVVLRLAPGSPAASAGSLVRRDVLETVALMGGVEILNTVGIALVYAVLQSVALPDETSRLYVLLLVSQAFTGLFLYLLRLAVPSASLRGADDPAGAARQARTLLASACAVAAVVGAGGATIVWSQPDPGLGRDLATAVVLAAGLVGFGLVTYGSMRLETTDAGGRRLAAGAALAGLAGVGLAAVLLVPRGGALGGLTAMLLGTAVQGVTGWVLVRRRQARGQRSGRQLLTEP